MCIFPFLPLGTALSLETRNELLTLTAYYGVGNPWASEYNNEALFINWPPSKDLLGEDFDNSVTIIALASSF